MVLDLEYLENLRCPSVVNIEFPTCNWLPELIRASASAVENIQGRSPLVTSHARAMASSHTDSTPRSFSARRRKWPARSLSYLIFRTSHGSDEMMLTASPTTLEKKTNRRDSDRSKENSQNFIPASTQNNGRRFRTHFSRQCSESHSGSIWISNRHTAIPLAEHRLCASDLSVLLVLATSLGRMLVSKKCCKHKRRLQGPAACASEGVRRAYVDLILPPHFQAFFRRGSPRNCPEGGATLGLFSSGESRVRKFVSPCKGYFFRNNGNIEPVIQPVWIGVSTSLDQWQPCALPKLLSPV